MADWAIGDYQELVSIGIDQRAERFKEGFSAAQWTSRSAACRSTALSVPAGGAEKRAQRGRVLIDWLGIAKADQAHPGAFPRGDHECEVASPFLGLERSILLSGDRRPQREIREFNDFSADVLDERVKAARRESVRVEA